MNINEWYNLLVSIYLIGGICYVFTFGIGKYKSAKFVMAIWLVALLFYTANRPIEVGTDTQMYSNVFAVHTSGISYDLIPVQQQINFAFFSITKFSALFSANFDFFLFVVSALFLFSTYIAFKLIFKQNWHLPFFIFASTFIYYSFLFNLIRNSLIVGGSFWALYLFFYNPTTRKRIFGSAVLLGLFLLHSSAAFIALAIIASSFLKSEKQALLIWFFVLALSIVGVDIFKTIQNLVYTFFPSSTLAFKTGVYDRVSKSTAFRLDFVLYTIFFGLIGYFVSTKWKDQFYASIVKWYLIQGSLFMLFFSFPYVDRIASLAWIGFPLIIGYPTIYWKGFRPYRFHLVFITFLFGILNLLLVARYDFHLELF